MRLVLGEVLASQQGVQQRPLGGGRGMGDQGGALALAEIPEGALAGAALVAEDAEEVVDQLESDAQQGPDRVEGLQAVR